MKTVAFDNGGEIPHIAKTEDIPDLETYFCDAHSLWQRGGIENTNGVSRRAMPRHSLEVFKSALDM